MVLLAVSASLASPALLSCARPGRSSAEPPPLSRRALLPLPLLPLLLPAAAPAADTFEYVENGEAKQLTEIQARDALTKKVEAATAAGKGLDLERRGQFNEKALFSEDFYFKYGLRPSASEALASPYVPPQGELPFSPVQRRYNGYTKYASRITTGIESYSGALREAVAGGRWAEVATLLDKGSKGKGSNEKGEGSGQPPSELRSMCRALGLFGNTALQSENDSGTTAANLLARHLVNELYFSMDDLASAAQGGDKAAAKEAWSRGRDYLNSYLRIVNYPIISRVGDKFSVVEGSL